MKFIEGRSLDAIIEAQGALPVPVVAYVMRGPSREAGYAHDRGIVHRDLKGANILVDRDGRVMVSDFGVALRASDVTLTADGTVIGTPPFMSPEQCAGRRAGPQSDQYSLGIVAFQMLTGAVPFQADTLLGIMHHHFFTPVPDVRLVRDDVPSALIDVLHVALAKEPGARYASTRDMLTAVEAIPFSEADRRESERLLRALAAGSLVEKIAIRGLPALPTGPTACASGRQATKRSTPASWCREARRSDSGASPCAAVTVAREASRPATRADRQHGPPARGSGQHARSAPTSVRILRAAGRGARPAAAAANRIAQLAVRGDVRPTGGCLQVPGSLSRPRGEARLRHAVLPRCRRAGPVRGPRSGHLHTRAAPPVW